ncbi:MAG: NUDIX hydrolase [Chloroflexi bacterium]|nr:NUDIX hydrolase [Chloroflexota bacterium]
MEETTVNTTEIYAGRIVNLVVLDVALPDGAPAKRELVRHPGAVAIIAVDADLQVLLVRQFRIAAGVVLREIPAGTLEPGEAPLICAERELREETGYRPGKLEPMGGIYVAPGYTTEYIHLFYATDLSEDPLAQDADEFIEVDRVPFTEALAMIERGDIVDGKSITGLLRVARRLNL